MGIEISGLSFSYGERRVLRDVSFSAGYGELIALLGPNGAGKSTLMRCMLGFIRDYTGRISVDGREIRGMSRAELSKRIAYIPQSAPSVFNYTVLDAVLMGVTGGIGLLSSPGAEQEELAEGILERLGIVHLAERGCEELSGGERQLVLLARALIQDARIVVMDEPTANLDYGNQNRVMEHVLELAGQGYTILFSTHDPNQAMLYAGRALTLRDGGVLTDGDPDSTLTEGVLETLYGIVVRKCRLPREYGGISLCLPNPLNRL